MMPNEAGIWTYSPIIDMSMWSVQEYDLSKVWSFEEHTVSFLMYFRIVSAITFSQ